jgi:beta-phosphoglucomutase
VSLRAIVFDFDGVIANSEPLHLRAYQDVLASEGLVLDEADYYARYLGYDDVRAFKAFGADRGRVWTSTELERLIVRKARRLEVLERDTSILFPGAADAIRRSSQAFPIAIASGALGAEIRRVLDREQLAGCFTAIVAAEDTALSKPAPDPYLRAVALLAAAVGSDLAADECVALEDSHWGLRSARAAGLHAVGVAQTYDKSRLVDAELVIDTIKDLNLHDLAGLCLS